MSILIKPSYDTDASAYFTTAGVTSTAGRQQISRFVTGIKDLGLWNNMVCWPLRSSQNAGTGTTAYSLGGLGTFSGTLTNGPTWGVDGVVFDGSNDRVALANNSFGTGNSATSIWVFSKSNVTASRQVVLSQGDNNSSTDSFSIEAPSGGGVDQCSMAFTAGPSLGSPDTSWKSIFHGNTTLGFSGKNGGTVSQYTLNFSINKSGTSCALGSFGNPAGVAPFNGIISAAIRINATPTTTLNGQVYSLYKSTLGQGLGLP